MKIIFISFIVFAFTCTLAQNYSGEHRKMIALDALSGGIVSGVGSMLHKHEGQTNGRAFLNGFWKGAAGASIAFYAKYLTHEIDNKNNLAIGWPCKIINAIGVSMIENGASGKPVLSNIGIDYGFIRVDISANKIQPRFQPFALLGIVRHVSAGNRIDFENSIKLGTPCFIQKVIITTSSLSLGAMYVNSVSSWNRRDYGTYSHELIHVFQSRSQLSFNNVYLKNNKKYIFFDIPVSDITYAIENIRTNYASNIYERQARILSSRY